MVKSEIIAPILARKKLAAALDIESYFAQTFTKPEQTFAESCAAIVADYLAKAQASAPRRCITCSCRVSSKTE
jgi:putative methionine-R-sulfoxide reductase with GAF domain